MKAYLHITNEQCKQNQSKSCHNNGKNYFPNKSACGKILSQGTAHINERKLIFFVLNSLGQKKPEETCLKQPQ